MVKYRVLDCEVELYAAACDIIASMKRGHYIINATCLFLSLFFTAGLFWIWGNEVKRQKVDTLEKIFFIEVPENSVEQPLEPKKKAEQAAAPMTVAANEKVANATTSDKYIKIKKIISIDSPLTGKYDLGPEDVNLIVPYTSQAPERNWDEPWQDACEEAAVLMLDAYYKGYSLSPLSAKDEMLKMISWEEEMGWGTSIEIEKIQQMMQEFLHFKNSIKIIADPTIEGIKEYLRKGAPVLVVADGKTLPNKYYSNGGPVYHALIIRGFVGDKFITNDPGVNRGRNFVFNAEDVMGSIHDWNGGNVKQGKRAILVVE